MNQRTYTRGLHDLGDSVYVYLQPDGSWGWSNEGLAVDSLASLLLKQAAALRRLGEYVSHVFGPFEFG
ncbi:MAG TPA: hypothetical protein VF043_17400 [Ktedonobacteraceae bacterium]